MTTNPSLFGLSNSNRDFSKESNWGKNQFNNCFPISLACYMYSKDIKPVYITLDKNLKVKHSTIDCELLLGEDWNSKKLYFDFESNFDPFEKLVTSRLPRIDLVTKHLIPKSTSTCLKPLEIKLTTLPDSSTCDFNPEKYSSEIVVRPDTIVYMALSIAYDYKDRLSELNDKIKSVCDTVHDWRSASEILKNRVAFVKVVDNLLLGSIEKQSPLVVQPIWKTEGKTLELCENCLDIFVWSDYAFTRLFVDAAKANGSKSISRHYRCLVWLLKMLYDFSKSGTLNHRKIIDEIAFDTKNDKAFAVSGLVTHQYLSCPELLKPRIKRSDIKHIVLGGGEKLLSPERRLDSAIQANTSLFS